MPACCLPACPETKWQHPPSIDTLWSDIAKNAWQRHWPHRHRFQRHLTLANLFCVLLCARAIEIANSHVLFKHSTDNLNDGGSNGRWRGSSSSSSSNANDGDLLVVICTSGTMMVWQRFGRSSPFSVSFSRRLLSHPRHPVLKKQKQQHPQQSTQL